MKTTGSLVVLDKSEKGVESHERLWTNALRVSNWFGTELRIFSSFSRTLKNFRFLNHLSQREKIQRMELVLLGTGPEEAVRAVLEELESMHQGLLLLELSELESRKKRLAAWKTRLLEGAACPVLLLPPGFRFGIQGFQFFFVPMSGESRSNMALDWAIRQGSELGIPVDILHVAPVAARESTLIGCVGDEFFLEYPRLVDEFISEASPFTSRRQKTVIRDFCHSAGDPMSLVSIHIAQKNPEGFAGLLVLEWKGRFEVGRALLVKQMLARGDLPILLVKQAPAFQARLKLGGSFEAA